MSKYREIIDLYRCEYKLKPMVAYFPFLIILFLLIAVGVLLCAVKLHLQQRRDQKYISCLESVIDADGSGFLLFDADEKMVHLSEVARQCFQSLGGENSFETLNDFISYIFDHAASIQLPLEQSGKASDFREVVDDGLGHYYLVEMHKHESHCTSVVVRDVTSLQKQNCDFLDLKESNEKLNLAIESSSCGIFIIDAKSEEYPLTFANRICRDVCEEGIDQSMPFSEFLSRLGKTDQDKKIYSVIQNCGVLQKHIRFDLDEEQRWFDFRLTPVFDAEGCLDLYVGVVGEITELKNKEAEINRAQKLDSLGQLSSGIAHDFNNILSIIEGYARMIEMNAKNTERVEEYVQKITEASARGAGLTKKMMAFARHKVKQEHVTDLRALMDEQAVLLKPLIDETIDFEVDLGEGDLFGGCDSDSFVQILMNLVVNARDAIGRGGRLRVYIEVVDQHKLPIFIKDREQSYLCLHVRDNGEGMSKEVCEQIFDPFYTTKEQGRGTGLGLSVAYGLVRDMGGYIDVRSELSVGTEFSVYIPRSDELTGQSDTSKRPKLGADGLDFSGFTALVVEDEPDLRVILSETLKRHNMSVIQAENGNEALVIQDDHVGDIDILITDLVMPGINGLKLAEMMKALHPDIETVFMSGYPARGEQAKVVIPDDALFMAKPFDYDELCLCVFNILKQQPSSVAPVNYQNVGEM